MVHLTLFGPPQLACDGRVIPLPVRKTLALVVYLAVEGRTSRARLAELFWGGLDEAAKCVLVSMDSTLKSNLSVGLPLDLCVYEVNRLQSSQVVCIDHENPYFQMIRGSWGEKLRQGFESIEDPQWNVDGTAKAPLCVASPRYEAMKKITHPGEKLV